jgi:hypothetical protein
MLGFAQLSFVVNIDRWGKGRAENEAMYGVDVFLYGRELCPNEIIRRLSEISFFNKLAFLCEFNNFVRVENVDIAFMIELNQILLN